MPLHPLTAAKKVCEARGWSVTNLEINKILYLAHMMLLGRSGGATPLVSEHFQAWDYGPVLPTVYHRAKAFGNEPVQDVFRAFPSIQGSVEANVIEEAVEATSRMKPGALIATTHWNNGAWSKYELPGVRNTIIANEAILGEYRARTK